MTEGEARKLGRLLAKARRRKGLTLRGLDDLTGVSYAWIGRMEAGEFSAPAPSKLTRVAEALEVPLEEIDRITRGDVSKGLPGMRTYFRTKYQLSPAEIAQIEDRFEQVRRARRDDLAESDLG